MPNYREWMNTALNEKCKEDESKRVRSAGVGRLTASLLPGKVV